MTGRGIVVFAMLSMLAIVLLAACEPEVVTVEVTRLVDASDAPAPATAAPATDEAAAPEATMIVTPLPTLPPQVITATVEVTPPPLGSEGRPVQLLFPPTASASTAVISQRGESLAKALEDATGLSFVVGIPDNEQTLVDLLCAAPADTIGVLSPAAYVLAHDQCDVQPGLVAQHDDLTWQSGMIVVRAGDGLNELADLSGKRWAAAEPEGLPALYFRAALADAGVEPAEVVAFPEDTSALLALQDEQVDFTTAVYVPPVMPLDQTWTYGEDDPEVWRALGISPTRSPIGYVIVAGEPEYGGYRLRDARARLFDTNNDIFDRTRILTISPPIPNEAVVLGADFPLSLARQVLTALPAFAASESCETSLCSADFYNWTGLEPVDDSAYDPIRTIIQKLDLEPADLWSSLGEGPTG